MQGGILAFLYSSTSLSICFHFDDMFYELMKYVDVPRKREIEMPQDIRFFLTCCDHGWNVHRCQKFWTVYFMIIASAESLLDSDI